MKEIVSIRNTPRLHNCLKNEPHYSTAMKKAVLCLYEIFETEGFIERAEELKITKYELLKKIAEEYLSKAKTPIEILSEQIAEINKKLENNRLTIKTNNSSQSKANDKAKINDGFNDTFNNL